MYTSERAAVTAIRELGAGWTVLPYDDSTRGVLGYCAIQGEQELIFQWAIFGRELEPSVELVNGPKLAEFVQSERPEFIHDCDDPKLRQIGFVSYRDAAQGRAIVRRASLSELKATHAHPRAIVMEAHDRLLRYERRMNEAKALKPYGSLRVWLMRLVRRFFPLR